MEIFLICFFGSYYCITIGLLIGWEKSVRRKPIDATDKKYDISVIVPARNEARSIGSLLQDLAQQHYKNFEVIIVDDHSTDSTLQVVAGAIDQDNRVRVISNSGAGKKTALTTGIAVATGTIIVTTDADCRVRHDWLMTISQNFQDQRIKMLVGPVRIEGDGTLFSAIQAMEFSSLIGSGVATLYFGIPTMCNGANLAFKKEAFVNVNGYADSLHIPSGDDEFLLKKIHKKYPAGVHFMGLGDAVVSTNPQTNWKNLLHQRIRWAGKWRQHPTIQKTLLAVYIFLFQLLTIALPAFVLTGWLPALVVLSLWAIKILVELLFLSRITISLQDKWNWPSFILLQLLYPFYVVVVGLFCNFLPFTWKERRLHSGKEKTG